MSTRDGVQHPINHAILRELEEAVASGIPEIMVDLINTFIDDSQNTFQVLKQAMSDGDVKLLEINAHSMKSSAATFGAEALSGLFAQIEHAAHTGELERVEPLLVEGAKKLSEVIDALDAERTRLLEA